MKKLLCLLGGAMLSFNAQSQKINITPFDIGDRIPDVPLTNMINYKDSVASLSSFGNKLIILDFWTTHCSSCIAMFPKEEALQKANDDRIQFILVTFDGTPKVTNFFHNWDSTHQMHLSMPIVTHDRLLRRLFKFKYIPHYVWLSPNGKVMAQTNDKFISQSTITDILNQIDADHARMKKQNWPADMYGFPKPKFDFLEILKIAK